MKSSQYIILFLISFVLGCSQDPPPDVFPPDESTEPVFISSFKIDGDLRSIITGLDDYYMYTDFTEDSTGYSFIGELKEANCLTNCSESIKFEIQDIMTASTNTSEWEGNIDSVLAIGSYDYVQEVSITNPGALNLTLIANAFGTPPFEYEWTTSVGDTDFITGEVVTFDISNQPFPIDITLKTTDSAECVSTHTKSIKEDGSTCDASIMVIESVAANTFDSTYLSVDASPNAAITWSNGDTGNAIQIFQGGEYCVNIMNAGCTASSCINYITTDPLGVSVPYCSNTFESILVGGIDSTTIINGRIKISYVDNNGTRYQSDLATQNSEAYFEVLSSSDYDLNEQGQKTRQLDIIFNCTLVAENGESIQISDGIATIAVSYP